MQIFKFLGRKGGKCQNSSSRPPKGTSLRENASFDVLDRENRSTVATCRRGEETKKRKTKENMKLSYRRETARQLCMST